MAPFPPLILSNGVVFSFCIMIYYLLALSDDELFYFQLMDLIIERWFPIKLDTLYKMK